MIKCIQMYHCIKHLRKLYHVESKTQTEQQAVSFHKMVVHGVSVLVQCILEVNTQSGDKL